MNKKGDEEKIQAILYRIFQIGEALHDYEIDDDALIDIGNELIELSGVCYRCRGDGMDGDPPDAAGIGGSIYPCYKCEGSGHLPQPDLREDI